MRALGNIRSRAEAAITTADDRRTRLITKLRREFSVARQTEWDIHREWRGGSLDAISACALQNVILKQEKILDHLCRELGEDFEPLPRIGGW
jgi:hypothetical protein